ncbi:MarR family winged helix-turn-helix transcriptional regulator [Pseudodesulfovibrio sp.]|uniref:MarR family winged helix-turn-helix transcriptional regulator n=1 Tax=unclassified Pseudodesulfovibrio TaxID=2661612 RepID=UPI003B009C6B
MFFLKEFPDTEMVDRVRTLLPDVDTTGMQVFIRLLALGSECLSQLDRALAEFDLSHGRWIVLMLLRRRKVWEARPSELAREQGITKASMSGLTQRLERQGLITRKGDEQDKRGTVLVLTDQGAALIERVLPRLAQLMEQTLSPLAGNERMELRLLLEKLFPLGGNAEGGPADAENGKPKKKGGAECASFS